ncbi:MAG: 3-deoxy-D-manno-octulosonic acid transferase [Bacteroidales bacterium]
MRSIYTFLLRLYWLVLWFASGFNTRAKAWISGRKGWKKELVEKVRKIHESESGIPDPGHDSRVTNHDLIWFHCASLGEFEQGRPVIEEIRARHPGMKIIVTFFSPSGYAIRRNYSQADAVVYLPLDTPENARFWVDTVKPRIAFFIKYEYWFNFLRELKSHNIPVVIASAMFREEQMFYQWYGDWFRSQLDNIHWFFVQNETSGKLIQSLGFDNVTISGDTRFDRVTANAKYAEEFPLVKKFCAENRIIMGGSTWPEDEAMLIPLIRAGKENIKFILATHDVSQSRIHSLEHSLGMPSVRFSRLTEENAETARILIIDTMGILSQLYQYAHLAFIGGAFGSGLHNILEAVVFGVPVFFGPKHQKFWEAAALIKKGGAFEIKRQGEFAEIALSFLSDDEKYKKISGICTAFIAENRGATSVILDGTDQFF